MRLFNILKTIATSIKNLTANNDASLVSSPQPIPFTPANGTNDGCYYYKIGRRVRVSVMAYGMTVDSYIFTLPQGYRPVGVTYAAGYAGSLLVDTQGRIRAHAATVYANVEFDAGAS